MERVLDRSGFTEFVNYKGNSGMHCENLKTFEAKIKVSFYGNY